MRALTTNPNPGEAAAARAQAERMAQRAGMTLADVPGLLGQAPPRLAPSPFVFMDIGTPEGKAAYAAHNARSKAERDRKEIPERAEVLRLLSNVDAAGLPDREIARRTGVPPQTVGNLRRKQAA